MTRKRERPPYDAIDRMSTDDLTAWIHRRSNDYDRLGRVCDLVFDYFESRESGCALDAHETLEAIERALRNRAKPLPPVPPLRLPKQ